MQEKYARAVSTDLGDWLERNQPPCFCEPKRDGFRVFLYKSGEKILFATRHGQIYSEASHPLLFRKIMPLRKSREFPEKLVLDGEYKSPDKLWIFDVLQVGDTVANDTLHFKENDVRIKQTIKYEDYKQFKSDVKITFGDAVDDKGKKDEKKDEKKKQQ